jgi:hypothetical protein
VTGSTTRSVHALGPRAAGKVSVAVKPTADAFETVRLRQHILILRI